MKLVVRVASLLILLTASVRAVGLAPTDFDWTTIVPSSSLNYTKCYGEYKCAKLKVPLDWLDPVNNTAQVSLAIITRPALVPVSDPAFGGTIITNPGGPGGSGVGFMLRAGPVVQRAADGENKKYEILSFDPRGMGFTTPNADCFRDEFARGVTDIELRAMGSPDESLEVLRRQIAKAYAFGNLCEHDIDGYNIRNFMSTSSVARDMVEIVDRLDDLRQAEVAAAQGDMDFEKGQRPLELRSASKEEKKGPPRILYWGFSYGTVLGNYFASMFPGRVGRMILEAVEDVHDYYNTTWALNLPDIQKALDHFWDTCYEAGSRCAIYRPSDAGPSDVRDRIETFMDSLDDTPAPYISKSSVVAITRLDILKTLFGPLYQPLLEFPRLATTLNEALAGNFSLLYKDLAIPTLDDSCSTSITGAYTWMSDASLAVACGDGVSQANLTESEFLEYLAHLKKDSPDFGAIWSNLRLMCKGWGVRPKYRFTGPWETPEADPSIVEGKPAAPLLIASSRIDPVTPLANAHELAKSHPGSVVLTQDNVGHGSLFSPGKCREAYVSKYFETGELPPKGTVCKPDCTPFFECPHAKDLAAMQADAFVEPWKRKVPLGLI